MRRIAIGDFLDLAETGIDPVITDLDLARIATMDTVIGQEVGIGFGGRAVIDRDDLDFVPALALKNRAQRQTADTTKTGNRNPKGHTHLSMSEHRTGERPEEVGADLTTFEVLVHQCCAGIGRRRKFSHFRAPQ